VRALVCLLLSFWLAAAQAEVNYHTVGWTNVFLPGGGEALMGNYWTGAQQAGLELSTFVWGYSLSAREPFTLDGVPEDLPSPEIGFLQKPITTTLCSRRNGIVRCYPVRKNSVVASYNTPQDISKPLFADVLQEIGLKTHMVNIYDSYRKAAAKNGIDFNVAHLDPTPTSQLFTAPFDRDNLLNPWVYLPLLLTGAVLFYSYEQLTPNDYPALPQFNRRSSVFYDLTYTTVFPVGSGAPEEMFYRGFLQSEFYNWSGSPWVSVPMSTALYALSHESDAQLGAALSGLYLGYLAHRENGHLKLGITYHFWSDIMTGLYSIAVVKLGQRQAALNAPPQVSFSLSF
jgi:membrane protease YdiL (CAAX protease family)